MPIGEVEFGVSRLLTSESEDVLGEDVAAKACRDGSTNPARIGELGVTVWSSTTSTSETDRYLAIVVVAATRRS